ADVERMRGTVAVMVGRSRRQSDEAVAAERYSVVGIARIGMRKRPDLVERNVARRVDAYREGNGARRVADMAFDHAAVHHEDDRLSGRDIDKAAVRARSADAERIG